MHEHEKLQKVLKEHEGWDELLEDSIKEACHKAHDLLNLRSQEHFKPYPDTLDKYFAYLDKMVHWIPTEADYAKEVLFQLCKFYWLLGQPSGLKLQNIKEPGREVGNAFTDWMVTFANDWGSFLDTTGSLTQKTLRSFYEYEPYNLDQYIGYDPDWQIKDRISHNMWMTFNQFFCREIKPGLRPIAGMFEDSIITAPADCTFKEKWAIDSCSEIVVKHTHKYKILQLLEGSPYQDRFVDGIFMHSFLGPNDYHRFHAPVRGTVLECRAIQAKVYLDVKIEDGEFTAPDGGGYEFTQTRGLIIFDSPLGLVAVLPIGMAQVSSVNMVAVEGAYLNKGDEFGYFQFGGSDIIMLFEGDRNIEVTCAPGIHTNVGMCVAQVV